MTSLSSCGEVRCGLEERNPKYQRRRTDVRLQSEVTDHLYFVLQLESITFLCIGPSPFAVQERVMVFLQNILAFPDEAVSKNYLCAPSVEHPNLEYFDNSIRFLELKIKEGIS